MLLYPTRARALAEQSCLVIICAQEGDAGMGNFNRDYRNTSGEKSRRLGTREQEIDVWEFGLSRQRAIHYIAR